MPIVRTKNKTQFVQDILSVFSSFRHSGKIYLESLNQSKGGDEFDVRDMIVKPLFRKLGYTDQDFYNEVTLFEKPLLRSDQEIRLLLSEILMIWPNKNMRK